MSLRMAELAAAFPHRAILSGAGMMRSGCLHAFAKVSTGKTLMVQKGKLRLQEGKGLA